MPFPRKEPHERSPLTRPKRGAARLQILDLQRKLYAAAMNDECDGRTLAQLTCAWEKLEERKRVMSRKPLPKSIEVDVNGKPVGQQRKRGEVSRANQAPSIAVIEPKRVDEPPAA